MVRAPRQIMDMICREGRNPFGKVLLDPDMKAVEKTAFLVLKLVSVCFHSLRRSIVSLLVQRGVSLDVVKELLGHEDLATTQIFSHLQQQNLREAVDLL